MSIQKPSSSEEEYFAIQQALDRHRLAVKKSEEMAADVAKYEFTAIDGGPLPPFDAGAHVDIVIAPEYQRQYSLAGDPADRSKYVLGVLREPAGRGLADADPDVGQCGGDEDAPVGEGHDGLRKRKGSRRNPAAQMASGGAHGGRGCAASSAWAAAITRPTGYSA